MILTYRPIQFWPGPRNPNPNPNPFRATWQATLVDLDRELTLIRAREPVLQVDASERDFRMDGQLRADARLRTDGVVLSFEHPRHGPLSYPCDSYTGGSNYVPARESGAVDQAGRPKSISRYLPGWQANVRAIVLTLEALRAVERHGAAQTGQQYTGWKQLGMGIAAGAAAERMTADQAARFMAEHAVVVLDGGPEKLWGPAHRGYFALLKDRAEMERAYKMAAKRLHPDVAVTGSTDLFQKLEQARRLLEETID